MILTPYRRLPTKKIAVGITQQEMSPFIIHAKVAKRDLWCEECWPLLKDLCLLECLARLLGDHKSCKFIGFKV